MVRLLRTAALACATLLAWLGPAAPAAARDAERAPIVTLAVVPTGTSLGELAEALPDASLGLMSTGLGRVPAAQTWLDVSQGARTWSFLHGDELPAGGALDLLPTTRQWRQVSDRARSAPAPLVPGLLAETIRAAGLEAGVDPRPPGPGAAAIVALDVSGRLAFSEARLRSRGGLLVRGSDLEGLSALAPDRRKRDMLIAVARPPGLRSARVPVAIAGAGFGGLLSSPSTRLRGYVLSTDIAPTILERLGVGEPAETEGSALGSEAPRDVAGLIDVDRRLSEVGPRRVPVVAAALGAWLAIALGWWFAVRGTRGRSALAAFALAFVYLPALLLLTAALGPPAAAELGIVLAAGPVLALGTLRLIPGWGALALACAITLGAQMADLAAGSTLTALSLLGPNPAVGARFFGVGNELVATYGVLVPVAVGAAIAALAPRSPVRAQVATFAVAGIAGGLVLGAGGLGASVGAAIVLAAGAAAAALVLAWPPPRLGVLVAIAAPVAAVAALAAADTLLDGDAHLSRSMLDGGGLGELGETAERRLRLTVRSFGRVQYIPFLVMMAPLVALAVTRRRAIGRWLCHGAVRAGYAGAVAATLVGTLANDSGAMLLIGGFLWLAAVTGFAAWAGAKSQAGAPGTRAPPALRAGANGVEGK